VVEAEVVKVEVVKVVEVWAADATAEVRAEVG